MEQSPVAAASAPSTTHVTAEVELSDPAALLSLAGAGNANLRSLRKHLDIDVSSRGTTLRFGGDPAAVALAERFFRQVAELSAEGIRVDSQDHVRALLALAEEPTLHLRDIFTEQVLVSPRGRPIKARGLAQRRYIHAMRNHDLTFAIGPAGTGKTYLAMAMAVQALLAKRIKRIILTRPAVEAGEKLGFLPGDLAEKVNPYLRPLYDALHDLMDLDKADGLIKRGYIEVAPLAFMRGRTLNDSFVILDEAQNSTSEQMRMFLTRLGYESQAAVTGDITQVDLPQGARSGLREARDLLRGIEGIAFCEFTDIDVVRHPLVQRIVVAYEQRDAELERARAAREQAAWQGSGSPPGGGDGAAVAARGPAASQGSGSPPGGGDGAGGAPPLPEGS